MAGKAKLQQISPAKWLDWFDRVPRGCYFLYVVQEGADGPVKVGITYHPVWRLSSLRGGNPRQLFLRAVWQFPAKSDALRIERRVQRDLACYALVGEWFNVEVQAVCRLIEGF